MWQWLTDVAYTAHGYCLAWDPWLIGLHAGSDLLIFGAYTAIPVAIWMFMQQRPKLQMKGLARFFAAFIFWCGLTHLVGLITLWYPIYDLQALVKAATAAISVTTAVMIFFLIPKALAIPSPAELQLVNDSLHSEVSAHRITLTQLQQTQEELEGRVVERTRSLEQAVSHSETLVREIAHRAGNLMSVIGAMARQSARDAIDPELYANQLAGRIEAMGRSHELLFKQTWRDISLRDLVQIQIIPFLGNRTPQIDGPPVTVDPAAAHNLGMVFYELATNATKYGSLSVPSGKVAVSWTIHAQSDGTDMLSLEWRESDGPAVQLPSRTGWGSMVIGKMISGSLAATGHTEFANDGLTWRLNVPLHEGTIGRRHH